jgi:hypothetical protein
MPVGEHGIFEWIYYEPSLDTLIAPLLFSFAGTSERDTLKPAGVKPRRLLPTSTFYHSLKKRAITSTILQHREYTPSTYSNIMFAGATARGYRTLAETLVNLSLMAAESKPPAYFVLYYDRIDAVCHEYGPNAPQTQAEILTFLTTLEQIFLKVMASNHKKILCLLTADHGHVETDPATTIYLNHEARFAGLQPLLRKDQQGKPIIPAGSPQVVRLLNYISLALPFLLVGFFAQRNAYRNGKLGHASVFLLAAALVVLMVAIFVNRDPLFGGCAVGYLAGALLGWLAWRGECTAIRPRPTGCGTSNTAWRSPRAMRS